MANQRARRLRCIPWLIGGLTLALLIVATSMRGRSETELLSHHTPAAVAIGRGHDGRFVTTIRRPSGPPTIELSQSDPQGRVGSVACSTCHSVREPDYANRTPADLDQFHQHMPMSHNTLACYSCHNPSDADTLRLADSTVVEYPNVMTLCAQCHGPQAKDFEHGAHGGMTGYWDLTRGPRTRNNCIDCHDPHVPKFPAMQPTFKPRDRFLDRPASHAADHDSRSSLFDSEVNGE